tara:strand:- start:1700 stop:2308 length:609 start_codon:yes stop_codon:yes gene_type:complete
MSTGRSKTITLVGIDGIGDDHGLLKAMGHSLKIFPVDDTFYYSKKMTREECQEFTIKELNDYIKTDFMLLIQSDGFISNPNMWSDTFFDYDYLGARWWHNDPHIKYAKSENIVCKNSVGNGGFTLRSKKFLEEASKLTYDGYSPEDAFLCIKNYDTLTEAGIRFAPDHIADRFSLEPDGLRLGGSLGRSFGFHGNTTIIDKI